MEELGFRAVSIHAIDEFVPNPRQRPNGQYERIKASIERVGLKQPLVLVERGNRFGLAYGGHTRLAALRDLWKNTGDDRFATAPAIVEPDRPNHELLSGHLLENELRQRMTLVEKALVVESLSAHIEKGGPMTQRELAAKLSDLGIPVAQSELSTLSYAAKRLYPLIPNALLSGMGRTAVGRLKGIDGVLRTIWLELDAGSEDEYDESFEVLARRRNANWDEEALRSDLELEISERSDHSLQAVRVAVDNMVGRLVVAPNSDAKKRTAVKENPVIVARPRMGLAALRAESFQAAHTLASTYGLGNSIESLPSIGLGFLVVDFPDAEVVTLIPKERRAQMRVMWWILVEFSELLLAPREIVSQYMDIENVLFESIGSEDGHYLSMDVPVAPAGQRARVLFADMDKDLCKSYVNLVRCYRDLHRLAGDQLWATSP